MTGYKNTISREIFVCIDCEATGLEIGKDEIIEIAICKFSLDETFETFETLIDPKISIPDEISQLIQITNDMVIGKPTIEDVLDIVIKITAKHVIVGHNVLFDIGIIDRALEKHGKKERLKDNPFIDTVRLARLCADSKSNKLENLRKHFNIEEEGAHRAMNDVLVNIQLFKYLARSFSSSKDILSRLKNPILLKNMPLGKYKGLPFREVPLKYLLWAKHQNFDQDLLYSIETEIKRRKKTQSFAESSNPFKDLSL